MDGKCWQVPSLHACPLYHGRLISQVLPGPFWQSVYYILLHFSEFDGSLPLVTCPHFLWLFQINCPSINCFALWLEDAERENWMRLRNYMFQVWEEAQVGLTEGIVTEKQENKLFKRLWKHRRKGRSEMIKYRMPSMGRHSITGRLALAILFKTLEKLQ